MKLSDVDSDFLVSELESRGYEVHKLALCIAPYCIRRLFHETGSYCTFHRDTRLAEPLEITT